MSSHEPFGFCESKWALKSFPHLEHHPNARSCGPTKYCGLHPVQPHRFAGANSSPNAFEKNHHNIQSFNELFTKNTVLNLSDLGGAGQDIVDIIATMFLEHLYTDYMKKTEKQRFEVGEDGINRRFIDSMVLIDEAHHALGRGFDVLMKMMLEGREFGLGVILSSQFLSHFQLAGRNWAEALSTWVIHNVKGARARDLENIGFRGQVQEMAQELSSLQPHWAYYRCANGQTGGILMKGQPFFSLPKS